MQVTTSSNFNGTAPQNRVVELCPSAVPQNVSNWLTGDDTDFLKGLTYLA